MLLLSLSINFYINSRVSIHLSWNYFYFIYQMKIFTVYLEISYPITVILLCKQQFIQFCFFLFIFLVWIKSFRLFELCCLLVATIHWYITYCTVILYCHFLLFMFFVSFMLFSMSVLWQWKKCDTKKRWKAKT